MNHPSPQLIQNTQAEFILASSSPRRLMLIRQLGIEPSSIISPDIDESERPKEKPRDYVKRMALEKLQKAALNTNGAVVLAADTTVACGTRILPQAHDEGVVRYCLGLLSGRRHQVFSSVAVMDQKGKTRTRTVKTVVSFKRLSEVEINAYIQSGEWKGKAGGYAIQGIGAAFIRHINGSYSGVVGLPLFETRALLTAAGIHVL